MISLKIIVFHVVTKDNKITRVNDQSSQNPKHNNVMELSQTVQAYDKRN